MLIKPNNTRMMSDDGLQSYKAVGFVIHMHNRFFSGSITFRIKYSYQDLSLKGDAKFKHGLSHVRQRGFDTKYFELRIVDIPKNK